MYEYSNTGNGCDPDFDFNVYKERGNQRCGTPYSVPYFFSFVVVTSWMVINLIIAAIIDGLSQAYMDRSKFINKEHMFEYINLWQQYDTRGVWQLKLNELWIFMANIPVPIGEKKLYQKWVIDEEKDNTQFYYSDSVPAFEGRMKVKKYDLLAAIKEIDFKLEKDKNGEIVANFKDFTKAIVTKAFLNEQLEN